MGALKGAVEVRVVVVEEVEEEEEPEEALGAAALSPAPAGVAAVAKTREVALASLAWAASKSPCCRSKSVATKRRVRRGRLASTGLPEAREEGVGKVW